MILPILLACASSDVPFDIDVDLMEIAPAPVAVEDVAWEVGLYDERPEAYLPAFLDAELLGPTLLADAVRRAEGDGFAVVRVPSLAVDVDAPLSLRFVLSSEIDRTYHLSAPGPVTEPPECTVTVDRETTAERHAADVLACLRAWVDDNGGPADLRVDVAGATEDDDWSFAATWVFTTDRPVEVSCTGTMVLDEALLAEADAEGAEITIETLELAGYLAAADEGCAGVVFANTWDAQGEDPSAGAHGTARVAAGEGAFVGTELEVVDPVPPSVVFRSEVGEVTAFPATWAEAAEASLMSPEGFVDACEVRVHDALPNDTWVHEAIVGTGTVVR